MSPLPPPGVLPPDFYGGKLRAYRATALVSILLLASSALLTATGHLDPSALLGPHVQRSEWAFSMTGVRELNARGWTGRGVTVCLVDSGLDALHPDFARAHLLAWRDLVNLRPEPYDDNGHGTAMAGLIAANGSLRGVAPEVALIVVKAINAAGDGSDQNVANAIHFCADPWGDGRRGADIISLSLGSKAHNFYFSLVYNAVAWATARGIFVVAAAGNDGGPFDDGDVEIPAQVPLAIAVGAVDAGGVRAPFSSMGSSLNRSDPSLKPEVVAPGVRLTSTAPGARYVTVSGTSPATALTSGLLALILQARPLLRPGALPGNVATVKWAIALTARRGPGQSKPHDPWYGYGIIDGPGALGQL